MRRDEIRIFPGNVETHVDRLRNFPDADATPLARPAPSIAPHPDLSLPYQQAESPSRRRWRRIERALVWVLTIGFALILGKLLPGLRNVEWADFLSLVPVALVFLTVPVIWIGFRCYNRWTLR